MSLSIIFNAYTGNRGEIDGPIRNGLRPTQQLGCSSIIIDCNGKTDWFGWCESRMALGERVVFKLNGMSGSAVADFVKYWEARPVAGMIDAYKVLDEPRWQTDAALVKAQLNAIHDNTARPSWLNIVPSTDALRVFFTLGNSLRDFARIFTIDHYPFEGSDDSAASTYKKSIDTYQASPQIEPLGMWLSKMVDAYLTWPQTKGITLSPANGFILGNIIQGFHFRPQKRADKADSYWVLDSTKLSDQIKMSLGKSPYDGVPTQGSRRLDYTVDGIQLLQFVSVYAWEARNSRQEFPIDNSTLADLIRAAVQDAQQNLSVVGRTVYPAGATIQPPPAPSQVAAPVASPAGGAFNATQSVTLATATAGATIRYTTDGSTPTSGSGTVYSGAITISATTTLKSIAYKSGLTDSAVTSQTYTISAPTGSAQLSPSALTLRYNVNGAIYLTNASGRTVTRATSSDNTVLNVWGVFSATGVYLPDGGGDHIIVHSLAKDGSSTVTFTLSDGSTLTCAVTVAQETVATPVVTPASGTYATAQSVVIACGTSGATIRYTTDGTDPTGSSPVYSTPIAVASTTVIKARAFKSSYTDSPIAQSTITIQTAPTGSPTSCKIFPVAGYEAQMDGAVIEASQDGVTWTPLYTVSGTPSAGWTTYTLSPTVVYRYMRVRATASKTIRVNEVEFYNGATKLTGGAISSPFNGSDYPAKAFDGSTSAGYFRASDVGGFIGLDVLAPNNTTPVLSPATVDIPLDWEQRVIVLNIGALSIKTVSAANALIDLGYIASDWFNVNSSATEAGTCDVTVTLSDDSTLTLACRVGLTPVVVAAYRSWPSLG